MKNKIIIGLILALSISMVGCNDKKEASSKDNTNVSQEESNSGTSNEDEDNEEDEGIDTTIEISDEKMIEIYETALPKIKELFKSICLAEIVEEYGGYGYAPDPNQISSIDIENENYTIGKALAANYTLLYLKDGSIADIRGRIDFSCDVNKIATEGFNFEESTFYPLVEALIGPGHDFSDVNEQVQKYYQGEDVSDKAKFDDGYFSFTVDCDSRGLYFGYNYFSKRSG